MAEEETSMKLYRNAIILIVVLGLLAGVYVVVKNKTASKNTAAQETSTTEPLRVFELEKEKISEITVENKDGKFVFAKQNDKWVATSPAGFKGSTIKVESIATNMAYLTADKVIDEKATDMAKYGLNSPVTVSAKLSDGTSKTVEIGDMTPTKNGYYLREKDSTKVYLIAAYTGGELKLGASDLRDKFIFTTDSGSIIGFKMEKAGKEVFTAKKLEEDNWILTSPVESNVNMSKLSPILTSVTSTNIMNFIGNSTDLDQYGLKSPSYSLEIETAAGKTKLLLGGEKVKGTEMYAMLDGGSEVFTVDETSVNFLDKPLKEVMEVFAYLANISDVSKIVVDMDGKTTTCDVQTDPGGDSDKDKFMVNGKDANMKDEADKAFFRKYYQALIGVVMSEAEPGATPSGTAEITFTYTLKKAPGTMKVEFIPKDSSYYYVVKNGKYSGIVVAKREFDKTEGVRETYTKLMDAMSKFGTKN